MGENSDAPVAASGSLEVGGRGVAAAAQAAAAGGPSHRKRKARGDGDLAYLSVEQALADYAELIGELQEQHGAPHAPVVGFGGSYGGMLAAWFRLRLGGERQVL